MGEARGNAKPRRIEHPAETHPTPIRNWDEVDHCRLSRQPSAGVWRASCYTGGVIIAARDRSREAPDRRLPRRALVLAFGVAAWSVFVVVIEVHASRRAMTIGPDPDELSTVATWGGAVVALVAMGAALVACAAIHRARLRVARWALALAAIAGLLGVVGAVLSVLALVSLPRPGPMTNPDPGF